MRPGHVEDLPAVVRLWEREVLAGRRDSAPQGRFMQRILSGFDWEACSRVEEDATGMRGVALVLRRHTEDTTVARVEAAVAVDDDDELLRTLIAWGVGLSRAAGAQVVQVWRVRGTAEWLGDTGLTPVRPWCRSTATACSNPQAFHRPHGWIHSTARSRITGVTRTERSRSSGWVGGPNSS